MDAAATKWPRQSPSQPARAAAGANPVASLHTIDPGVIMPTILKNVLAALACALLLGGCDTKPEPTKPKVAISAEIAQVDGN